MKRILVLLTFVNVFSAAAMAQNDLSAKCIIAPVSGFDLTSTENVNVYIKN